MVLAGQPYQPPPINFLLLATILAVQLPVMIALPVLLGWWIRRRGGVGWGVFAMGMLSFVLSQLVHLPLNFVLGLLGGGGRAVGFWPLLPQAIVVGLSAGICEEGVRWLVLTALIRKTRGWRAGLQFGAGHGGTESIILGLLAAVNLGAILASRSLGAVAEILPPDALEQLRAAQSAFWSTSAGLPIVGALERICALSLQIAMASLVMRSITHRQPLYFLGALSLHAIIDFWAVVGMRQFGIAATEAGIFVIALFGLWIIWRLREQPSPSRAALTDEASIPIPSAATLQTRSLSPEELARRADRSRYE